MKRRIRDVLVWFAMLFKRTLKKTGFIVLLFSIPLLALLVSISGKEDTSFIHVAVAINNEADRVSSALIEDLDSEEDLFSFICYDTPDSARDAVVKGEVDAAWIFPGNLEQILTENARGKDNPIAKVYEREDNMFLKLSREKIFCTLYPEIAYPIYREAAVNEMLPKKELSEEELRETYQVFERNETLIDFEFVDHTRNLDNESYLTAPLRGLLVIMILLCGISSTMYFLKDDADGCYTLLGPARRYFVLFGYNLCAVTLSGIFVTAALILSGNYTSFIPESIGMVLYILSVCAFCSLLGAIIPSVSVFCLLLPTLLLGCVLLCPIFFSVGDMPVLQTILPPYHYLCSVYDRARSWYMLLYAVISVPAGYFFYKIIRK